jgi:hypothetical protein
MDDVDLERLVEVHVRALPPPRAPQTLLPRVMAAVQQLAMRPWYRRAWFTWPRAGQLAALAGLLLLTAGSLMLLPEAVGPVAAAASSLAADRQRDVAAIAGYGRIAWEVGGVLWRTMFEPLVVYAFGVVLLMCLACAVFGAALNHVAFGRMSEQ